MTYLRDAEEVMEAVWLVETTVSLGGRALVEVIQIGSARRVALLGLMEDWLADYG
jgi:hypothetical protein